MNTKFLDIQFLKRLAKLLTEVTPEKIQKVAANLRPKNDTDKELGNLEPALIPILVLIRTFSSITFEHPDDLPPHKRRAEDEAFRKEIKSLFWGCLRSNYKFRYPDLDVCQGWVVVRQPPPPEEKNASHK